jgi:hypothetical protein
MGLALQLSSDTPLLSDVSNCFNVLLQYVTTNLPGQTDVAKEIQRCIAAQVRTLTTLVVLSGVVHE